MDERADDPRQDPSGQLVLRQGPPGAPAGRSLRAQYWHDVAAVCGLPDDGDGPPGDDDDLTAPHGAFWVAHRDDEALGCVGARLLPGSDVEVKRLYVAPAARGLGLARALLSAVERWGRERGAQRLVLDTHAALTAAVRLYEATGFTRVEPYNDNPHAQLWFARAL